MRCATRSCPRETSTRSRRESLSRSCSRESSGVSVISVSQRSKEIARIIVRESPRTFSIQLHTSRKAFVVSMKILECRLRIVPAVVAGPTVEVYEPQPFHFDPEPDDGLRIEVKGLWLVDFDSGAGYYCWHYPEPALEYFHGYDEGFPGRVKLN